MTFPRAAWLRRFLLLPAVWLGAAAAAGSDAMAPAASSPTSSLAPQSVTVSPGSSDLELKSIAGLIRSGRYLDAERAARNHLVDVERLYGAESLEAALVLDRLAEALRLGGKAATPEALQTCVRAIGIKERRLAANDPELAVSLHNLGALHLTNGNFDKARPLLDRALQIRLQAYGENNIDVARSLLYLANLDISLGAEAKAKPSVERAIAIFDRVLAADDPERARALNMLGMIAYNQGDFPASDSLMNLTLRIQTGAFGAVHPLVAQTLQNLGSLRGEMGDYEEAERYLRRALEIRRKTLGPQHALVAFTLMSLGRIYEAEERLDLATLRYQEALRIQNLVAPRHPDAGWIQARLGRLAVLKGENKKARKLLDRAYEIQMDGLGTEHPDLAWTLLDLGRVEASEGKTTPALEAVNRAVDIQQKALGPNHPDLAQGLALKAELLAAAGDTLHALETALEASRTRTDHLFLTAAGFSERQGLAYAAVRHSPLTVALSLVAGRSGDRDSSAVLQTWDALLGSRTVVLDEMAARYRAAFAATGDSSLTSALDALRRASQRYANLLVRGGGATDPARYRSLVALARSDLEGAERAIGSRSAALKNRDARLRIHLADVRSALPPRWGIAAFAEYETAAKPSSPARRRLLAMVLDGSGEVSAVDLGPTAPIEAAIRTWTELILAAPADTGRSSGSDEMACRKAGGTLRSLLWDPVRARLGDVRGVFIVPDGPVNRVAFAGLPDSSGSYLVESGPLLHYVSSERDIVGPRDRPKPGQGLLALGDPAFGGSAATTPERGARRGLAASGESVDCVEFERVRFHPLPETLTEVREIARSWAGRKDVLVLTGEQARESAFKSLAPGREVVHIATHGFFLDTKGCVPWGPEGTRGISIIAPAMTDKAWRRPRARPLLLSGLALAGANRRDEAGPDQEDGILTADEVASVNLRGVSWVVLSACDTGLGRIQGSEGVLGLRRAFTVAGAGTLLMSLWSIEDRSARDWMKCLYAERFEKGLGTAEAVREASRDVLRERRAQSRSTHPFYWAAFVAIGDWR